MRIRISAATSLCDLAAAVATPDALAVLDPARLRARPMPARFGTGRRLGFDLRVRPVRRLGRSLVDPQSDRRFAKGAEVDAFRFEALQHGTARERDRGRVYADWLAERFGEAVGIETCRLSPFSRSRATRGDGRGPNGPDATLLGTLAVKDPAVFARLVRKGVGRHKPYGYGMILLRAARNGAGSRTPGGCQARVRDGWRELAPAAAGGPARIPRAWRG